jgi:hypothetical protein
MVRPTAVLAVLLYATFCHWYGGSGGEVMSKEEAGASLKASCGEPMHSLLARLFAVPDDGGSFLMLNLVKQRPQANYDAMPALRPAGVVTGAHADSHYASIFLPKLFVRAGHPVFLSRTVRPPIMLPVGDAEAWGGPGTVPVWDTAWDYTALVRYVREAEEMSVGGLEGVSGRCV